MKCFLHQNQQNLILLNFEQEATHTIHHQEKLSIKCFAQWMFVRYNKDQPLIKQP